LSDTSTRGIRIQVRSRYEEERSSPHERYYFFSYRVRISNEGDETAQLIEGPGVVGETPTLAPGESFEYTSFCPLKTPVGTMEGHYVMEVEGSGERFEARIDPFTLAVPGTIN
jgi:ApaG protein